MVLVKADAQSEAGALPTEEMLTRMSTYNEALESAGILLAGEGLHPSSRGVRVRFDGAERTVTDGPFPETKELVAGYWLWEVASVDEAVAWIQRAPFDGGAEIEIRPVFEADDFGDAFTPALREQEERQRERLAARA